MSLATVATAGYSYPDGDAKLSVLRRFLPAYLLTGNP